MGRRSETTTKVFVGSLPPNVTTDDLRRLFTPYGAIAECDIANKCGFLHLEDKELAMKAIEELNNTTFMGGRISVEMGRVKPAGMRSGGGGPRNNNNGSSYGYGNARNMPYNKDGRGRNGMPMGGGRGRPMPPYGRVGGGPGLDALPPPMGYDGYGDDRGQYDDRHYGGGGNSRPYATEYDRRPAMYSDDNVGYGVPPGPRGYDDRRVPPGPAEYDERRYAQADDRRALQHPDVMGQPRPLMSSYDRGVSADMYSRRDATPKPLMSNSGYSAASGPNYNTTPMPVANYTTAPGSGYSTESYNTAPADRYGGGGNYMTGYGDRGASQPQQQPPPPPPAQSQPLAANNYETRGHAVRDGAAVYQDNGSRGSYAMAGGQPGYSTMSAGGGGYGDGYGQQPRGVGSGSYDNSYPPLPSRGGYGGGHDNGSGGSGPRRDVPPTRRY